MDGTVARGPPRYWLSLHLSRTTQMTMIRTRINATTPPTMLIINLSSLLIVFITIFGALFVTRILLLFDVVVGGRDQMISGSVVILGVVRLDFKIVIGARVVVGR